MNNEQLNKIAVAYLRKLYLESTPSIDIKTADQINCREHKLKMEVFSKLNKELREENDMTDDQYTSLLFAAMNQGPKIEN